jgi:hypothetical protein
MHAISRKPGASLSALAGLTLMLAGCSSDSADTSDPVADAAESMVAPSAADDGQETSADPAPAEDPAADPVADPGPPAKAGEGSFQVNGTTYALKVTECTFNDEGLAEGTFEIAATDADGHPFEMTQFYLNGDWSQTDVQLDLGPTKIYVIRSAASDGAAPAEVNGTNVTWSETYRELDEAANSQQEIGTGTLNITCT